MTPLSPAERVVNALDLRSTPAMQPEHAWKRVGPPLVGVPEQKDGLRRAKALRIAKMAQGYTGERIRFALRTDNAAAGTSAATSMQVLMS